MVRVVRMPVDGRRRIVRVTIRVIVRPGTVPISVGIVSRVAPIKAIPNSSPILDPIPGESRPGSAKKHERENYEKKNQKGLFHCSPLMQRRGDRRAGTNFHIEDFRLAAQQQTHVTPWSRVEPASLAGDPSSRTDLRATFMPAPSECHSVGRNERSHWEY